MLQTIGGRGPKHRSRGEALSCFLGRCRLHRGRSLCRTAARRRILRVCRVWRGVALSGAWLAAYAPSSCCALGCPPACAPSALGRISTILATALLRGQSSVTHVTSRCSHSRAVFRRRRRGWQARPVKIRMLGLDQKNCDEQSGSRKKRPGRRGIMRRV